jgi:hypothetical protein
VSGSRTSNQLPFGDYDLLKIEAIISGLYRLHKKGKGWTIAKLMKECPLDDVMRLSNEAARQFAVLRRAYPAMIEVPIHVIDRKPIVPDDEVIVFTPFRNAGDDVRAEWQSLAPTFIDDGKWEIVRSNKPALVKRAFKDAFACARRTPGTMVIWIDDPLGLFPRKDRPKFKGALIRWI